MCFFWFFFSPSGKLEIRLLGCEDLQKPLTKPEEENLSEDGSSFAAHEAEEPSGKRRFGPPPRAKLWRFFLMSYAGQILIA